MIITPPDQCGWANKATDELCPVAVVVVVISKSGYYLKPRGGQTNRAMSSREWTFDL